MENIGSSLDVKIDAINELETSDIEKAANDNQSRPFTRLVKLFEDSAMTENEILDLVGITFVLEALILSEKMRDEKLTNLSQEEVEDLSLELYLSLERKRGIGDSYSEMCEIANKIIRKHLSLLKKRSYEI